MTERFTLLLQDIQTTNLFLTRVFLFALFALIAYPVLNWTPAWMRRPAQVIYLATLLAAYVLTTVYFSGL